MADCEKADAAAITTPKGNSKKGVIADDKLVVLVQVESTKANAAHVQLVDVPAKSKAVDNKARADLEGSKIRNSKVEQEAQLADSSLDVARKQIVETAKTGERRFCQLKKGSGRAQLQLLERKVTSLKPQMGNITKARDDAAGSVAERSRQANMLEAYLSLQKYELESLERKDMTCCNMEVVCHKLANDGGDMNDLSSGLRQISFDACWHQTRFRSVVASGRQPFRDNVRSRDKAIAAGRA